MQVIELLERQPIHGCNSREPGIGQHANESSDRWRVAGERLDPTMRWVHVSVYDLTVHSLVERLDMRNLERAHRLDRQGKRFVCTSCRSGPPQALLRLAQRAKHAGAIESLPRAVFTKAHTTDDKRLRLFCRNFVTYTQ